MADLNFNASNYIPMQPEDDVNEYYVWVELCKRMDRELADARLEWRDAVQERDISHRMLKAKTDALREQCLALENRKKPNPPKKENA